MAFMKTPTAAGTGADRMPVLAYDARSGRLFLFDRAQGDDGKWATVKTDVTRAEPTFAVDFGTLQVGWIYFPAERAPMFALAPYGQPPVPEPAAPADGGKFKPGFRVSVVSRAIGGLRDFAGNSAALIGGMNELHDAFEEAPEARAGKLPLVKIADTREVRSGQACNYAPIFEIQGWVDRPAVLGPRIVPPPGGAPVHAQPARTPPPAATGAGWTRQDGPEIDDLHEQMLTSSRTRAPARTEAPPARVNGTTHMPARARFAAQVA